MSKLDDMRQAFDQERSDLEPRARIARAVAILQASLRAIAEAATPMSFVSYLRGSDAVMRLFHDELITAADRIGMLHASPDPKIASKHLYFHARETLRLFEAAHSTVVWEITSMLRDMREDACRLMSELRAVPNAAWSPDAIAIGSRQVSVAPQDDAIRGDLHGEFKVDGTCYVITAASSKATTSAVVYLANSGFSRLYLGRMDIVRATQTATLRLETEDRRGHHYAASTLASKRRELYTVASAFLKYSRLIDGSPALATEPA